MAEPAFDLSEILDLYKEDARRSLQAMRGLLATWENNGELGDSPRKELRRLAHQLRGSGRTYGYHRVTAWAKAMERILIKAEGKRIPVDERVRNSLMTKVKHMEDEFRIEASHA